MKKLLVLLIVLTLGAGAYAQIESPVKWGYGAKRISPTEAVVFLRATIDDGWHIYSANQKDGGPIKTSFEFTPSKEYTVVGKIAEPTPVTKFEKSFSMDVLYFENSVTFQQKVHLKTAGATVVKGKLEYMTCNDHKCLPPDDIEFSIPVSK
jgi:DsbC/DsbD-like thiol-disulfide interchange protein